MSKRLIIDVREPYEYALSHVEGALNLPPAELLGDLRQLTDVPKDTQLIVYCRTGSRSDVAINILREKGFTNLVNGINEAHVTAQFTG